MIVFLINSDHYPTCDWHCDRWGEGSASIIKFYGISSKSNAGLDGIT